MATVRFQRIGTNDQCHIPLAENKDQTLENVKTQFAQLNLPEVFGSFNIAYFTTSSDQPEQHKLSDRMTLGEAVQSSGSTFFYFKHQTAEEYNALPPEPYQQIQEEDC